MAKNDTTLYLYELAWILPSVALPVGMLAALLVTAFGAHIHLPGQAATIDPARIDTTAPFDQPGLVEIGPGRYEARIIAAIWFFNPPEIRVPEGSEVTFVGGGVTFQVQHVVPEDLGRRPVAEAFARRSSDQVRGHDCCTPESTP